MGANGLRAPGAVLTCSLPVAALLSHIYVSQLHLQLLTRPFIFLLVKVGKAFI